MDQIQFQIDRRHDPVDGIVDAVSIFINGRDLVQIVREMESPFAVLDGKPDLARSYVGLSPNEVFSSLTPLPQGPRNLLRLGRPRR